MEGLAGIGPPGQALPASVGEADGEAVPPLAAHRAEDHGAAPGAQPGGGEFARLRRGALVGGQLMPAAVRPAPLQTAGPEGGVGLIPGKNHIARPSGKDGVHALVRLLPLEVRLGARGQGAEARAAHAGLARLAHHELRQPPGGGVLRLAGPEHQVVVPRQGVASVGDGLIRGEHPIHRQQLELPSARVAQEPIAVYIIIVHTIAHGVSQGVGGHGPGHIGEGGGHGVGGEDIVHVGAEGELSALQEILLH